MNDAGTGPVDFDTLDRIESRLHNDHRFEDSKRRRNSLVLEYDLGHFPRFVDDSYMGIKWYITDDFGIHYLEEYDDGETWECRWDKHPNGHNDREHFHPPPDASTPGSDRQYPEDWRDVISLVLKELDEHIQAFW